jgi:hypothetical protein
MTLSKPDRCGIAFGALAALTALVESKVSVLAAAVVAPALLAVLWLLAAPQRWIAAFLFAAILLPPLPFALGDSGPHPAVLVALVGVLAGLVYAREWRLRVTSLSIPLLSLGLVTMSSAALASLYSSPSIAAASLARAVLFLIAIYVFFFAAYGPGSDDRTNAFREVRVLFLIASLAALFACIDFYYQFPAPGNFSPQFIWLDSGILRRAQGLFYEASTLGNFCSFFLVMIAVALFRPAAQRPVGVVYMIVGGALFLSAMVLSYSRASIVNLVVSFVALGFLQRKQGSFRRALLIIACTTAAVGLACYQLMPDLFRAYGFRIQLSFLNSVSSTNGVLSGRLDGWRSILHFLATNPWHLILGVGYKTLPYSDYVGRPLIVDNAFLSALAETGLVGLTALICVLFAVLRSGYRAARDPDPQRSFFGGWTFCFWCGQIAQMLSGDLLTYWRVLPIYFWVLALAVR